MFYYYHGLLDNPAKDSIQNNLDPLESWRKGGTYKKKPVSERTSQIVGLANAAGSPGDNSAGTANFLAGNRNFYWAGVASAQRKDKGKLDKTVFLDDRDELEAGLGESAKNGKPKVAEKGQGWFPVARKDTGYYISTTSMSADGSAPTSDPNHYLDSTVVPYAVWANRWKPLGVNQGDFGLAIENATGSNMAYVYGDSGTIYKVGECSQRMNSALGNGAGTVTFIAFPGSGAGPGHALGPHPESMIPHKVFGRMTKLQGSSQELAKHLAMGPELAIPKKQAAMTPAQATLYKSFSQALSAWTMGG